MADPAKGTRGGRAFLWVLSALAGLGILILIALRTGIQDFLVNLRLVDPLVIIPLVAVYSISWLLRGLRLKKLLRLAGCETGLFLSLGVELIADLPNQFIPAKLGDTLKVAYLHRSGIMDYREGAFTAFAVRAMDLAAVIALALVSSACVSRSVAAGQSTYLIAISLIMLFLAAAGWVFVFRPDRFRRLLTGPVKGLRDSAEKLSEQFRSSPGGLLAVFFVSMLVWIFDILTLLIFLTALGVRLSFAETAFVMLLSTVAKIVPFTPNGLGLYEGTMVVLLGSFGIDESTAFTVAILDHGFMNIFSMIISMAAVYSLGLGLREAGHLLRKNEPFNRSDRR